MNEMSDTLIGQHRLSAKARNALLALTLAAIGGCQAARHDPPTSDAPPAIHGSEEERMGAISRALQARYKVMADAGDPKGIYYMAVVYAAKHRNDRGMDALNVRSMYEEAIRRGSNDARVALGNMLVCGPTHPLWTAACLPNSGLPQSERDPVRGIELLKQAASSSCSFTEPLIGNGSCGERESSIPKRLKIIYREGEGGIPKDPLQEAYWRTRQESCQPEIDRLNHQRGC